ncbi:MAG: hypothetical protein ACPGVG_13075 [Mycobacterium sp.]
MTATEAEREVVKIGLAQIPTGDESFGLVKLVKWIEDGKPLLLDGAIVSRGVP